MKYGLRLSSTFERELRKLHQKDKERIWAMIRDIQEFPYSNKALTGQLGGTRSARIGDLRIIYAIDEGEKRIILIHVGHRERVYER